MSWSDAPSRPRVSSRFDERASNPAPPGVQVTENTHEEANSAHPAEIRGRAERALAQPRVAEPWNGIWDDATVRGLARDVLELLARLDSLNGNYSGPPLPEPPEGRVDADKKPPTMEQFAFIAQTWKNHKPKDIAHAHLKDAIRYGLWLEEALDTIFDQLLQDAIDEGHDPADAHEDIRESHRALMDVVVRRGQMNRRGE